MLKNQIEYKDFIGNNKWEKIEFKLIISLSLLGIYFIISSLDILTIYIALEIYTFSSIILVLIKNSKSSSYVSIVYFFINAIASCIILLGFYYIYSNTGNYNLIEYKFLNSYMLNQSHSIEQNLVIVGILIKLGLAPFHYWLIVLYYSVPTIITLYQSLIPKLVYIVLLNNILYYFSNNYILYILITYSIFIGSLIGINHYKIKKILASSSILNVGLLLLALITQSYNINFIYILNLYIINVLNLFLILLLFINIDHILDLKYIRYYYPMISFILLISILSLIGLPPFSGFYYKILIIYNSLLTYNIWIYIIILISIVSFIISSNYYLYFVKTIYNNFFYYINNTMLFYLYPSIISYWIIITFLFILLFPFFINQYFLLFKFFL